jgi:hypothetical protein
MVFERPRGPSCERYEVTLFRGSVKPTSAADLLVPTHAKTDVSIPHLSLLPLTHAWAKIDLRPPIPAYPDYCITAHMYIHTHPEYSLNRFVACIFEPFHGVYICNRNCSQWIALPCPALPVCASCACAICTRWFHVLHGRISAQARARVDCLCRALSC